MSRIDTTFAALKTQRRKALIPFVTAGYPYADVTPELMHAMVAGGADVIELGVPFSDPSADGPVIQKAGDKALAFGIGLVQVIAMVREFRKENDATPVVLMGYANPIERYDQKHGAGSFVRDASAAGEMSWVVHDSHTMRLAYHASISAMPKPRNRQTHSTAARSLGDRRSNKSVTRMCSPLFRVPGKARNSAQAMA